MHQHAITQRHVITFQQDNIRSYIVRVVMDLLTQQNINVLLWSSVPLDLTPIEHVYDEMERRL